MTAPDWLTDLLAEHADWSPYCDDSHCGCNGVDCTCGAFITPFDCATGYAHRAHVAEMVWAETVRRISAKYVPQGPSSVLSRETLSDALGADV